MQTNNTTPQNRDNSSLSVLKLEYFDFEQHPENAAVKDINTKELIYLAIGEDAKPKAKFIVSSCNNHQLLIDALKEVTDDLFYQIESKVGAEQANKYPSIERAKTLLSNIENKPNNG